VQLPKNEAEDGGAYFLTEVDIPEPKENNLSQTFGL
jgi:hypothetical protein